MSHLHTTRNPQSEARRQHVHGPLLSQYPGGAPAYARDLAVLIFGAVVFVIGLVAAGE